MKSGFGVRVLLALVWGSVLSLPAAAAALLYATGGGSSGLSGLHVVDPVNGSNTPAWSFNGIHIYAGGLAYDAASDKLFATGVEDSSTGTSRLFAIDRATGAVTAYGGLSSFIGLSSGGLAIHPLTGVMYATGFYNDGVSPRQSTALYTIDKTSGAATLIGFAGGNCCSGDFGLILYGLGFHSDGTLFANGLGNGPSFPVAHSSHLFTVNLATGAATNIGPSGVTLGRSLTYSGLAFAADGTLLSLGSLDAASGALYVIDPATGAATSLAAAGLPYGGGPIRFGADGGLTFAPAPVPEPAAVWLFACGLLGVIAAARPRGR